jgi:hypothetical protein
MQASIPTHPTPPLMVARSTEQSFGYLLECVAIMSPNWDKIVYHE